MKFLPKIVSCILAVHLLVATSGPPLVYHFCGDEIDSIGIGTAKQCACNHDENETDACCEKDCCHDELYVSEFHPDGLLVVPTLAPESPVTIFYDILPFASLFHAAENNVIRTLTFDTHPPARSSDIPVLFRSLLI